MKEMVFDSAINEIDSLIRNLKKSSDLQIRAVNEKAVLKATALSWFNNHKKSIDSRIDVSDAENLYHNILDASGKNSSRAGILKILKDLKKSLIELRKLSLSLVNVSASPLVEVAPDFSSLVGNPEVQKALARRWLECSICIKNGASLAATVMIGGLLEGLLLVKINQEKDQSRIYKAFSAPVDKKTSKIKPLSEWTLSDMISVAHELKWISRPVKDISTVLREYRNYIHPHKEVSNKVSIGTDDAQLFWDIAKNISVQLLR